MEFPNLGLLVIDEEQKFGVNQKEKLKVRERRRKWGGGGASFSFGACLRCVAGPLNKVTALLSASLQYAPRTRSRSSIYLQSLIFDLFFFFSLISDREPKRC